MQRGCVVRGASVGALAFVFFGCGALGCGGNVMTRDVGIADVSDQSTVRVADDRADGKGCDGTFFTDWSADTAAAIGAASERGLVAVRVEGCRLEVLADCHLEGSYDFVPVTPSRDRTEVSDENAIAIGVIGKDDKRIGAEAGMGRGRSIDYAIVGQRMAKAAPSSVSGACDGATHYLSALSVGAYELASSSHTEVSALVKLHAHDDTHRHAEGDIDRCSKHDASTDDACRAPLKVELSRLPKK